MNKKPKVLNYGGEEFVSWEEARFNWSRKFDKWLEEEFPPMEEELLNIAQAPHIHWTYLFELERQKLKCMVEFFSHFVIADEHGNYDGKEWMVLCIKLLDYIIEKGKITPEQINRMNVRNTQDLFSKEDIQKFIDSEPCPEDDEQYYFHNFKWLNGRGMYGRKLERLYYRIRLEKMHEWWC